MKMTTEKTDKLRVESFIGHKEYPANKYMEVKDPGRLTDTIGEVAIATPEDACLAVESSHFAFHSWKEVPLSERQQLLLKAAEMLEQRTEEIVDILAREIGVLKGVMEGEIAAAARVVRNIVDLSHDFFQPKKYEDTDSWVIVEKRPMGVVVGIVPWNAPVILTMQKLAPALIAGNTIVMKPSPNAPLGVSLILKKIALLFPPGVINVVHGEGDVGDALNQHPLTHKISFTGGNKVAKLIMQSAAQGLKKVHFELGGNDPAIVLDDIGVHDIQGIIQKMVPMVFRRAGQVCFAIKRIYVPDKIYEPFIEAICQFVDEYKIGHPLNPQTTIGPVNNKLQYDFVKDLIEKAKHSNAKVYELGQILAPEDWENGYYIQPTVVADIDSDHELVTKEQFGPVIPVVAYASEKEAIKAINQTDYGLSASVWSNDIDRALQVTKKIESGMTYVNGHTQSALGLKYMPFGGIKQSGIGRENSEVGLAEFIEYHTTNVYKE